MEKNAKAVACVRQNITAVCKSLGRNDTAGLSVLQTDALAATLAAVVGEVPDLVFIDPPYDLITAVAPGLFARLTELVASKPDALVIFELPGELELAPMGWVLRKRLGKGARQPTVAFFQRG